MKRLLIFTALLLAACGGNALALAPEMTAAMNASADEFDAQFPGNTDINIARICADSPTALYWNAGIQTYAVTCVMPSFSNTFGVVLLDTSNVVLNTSHVNAVSQNGLEDFIGGLGWERAQ